MKTDPKKIKDKNLRMGYETALREYKDEISIGKSILEVLDNRYEFSEDDY